ncbi:MAG: phosphomethylpyrimidine synthase ThiC [Desulfobacteraceae bacterium]|nr:phosphomethylpyrimidine synthase ThiC [Desulfobacteraceae bacterium]
MTLKQDAKNGNITDVIRSAAAFEGVEPEMIRRGIADGTIVIPQNRLRSFPHIRAVGNGMRTKINANIGASPGFSDLDQELKKLETAVAHGTDAVMDLSLGPDQMRIRRKILAESPVMVGTVPIYQTGFEMASARRDIAEMRIDDFLKTIEQQAREGVDFMTIHSGITRSTFKTMSRQGRLLDVVSRGGSFMWAWLSENDQESPLFEYFDDILDILAAYDVTLSLGDGMRPGTTADASDRAQISELIVLGELAQQAGEKGVQVIIEGPGHVPLDQVPANMRLEKTLCNGAPFYILGPLVTDIASGYDHIAGAIGGAVAAQNGADFLCVVTPAEHLKLPSIEDVAQGVIAARIAAHAADLANGMAHAREKETAMAMARKQLDWETQTRSSIDPEKAARYRQESMIGDDNVCTMCGDFCAIRRINDLMS